MSVNYNAHALEPIYRPWEEPNAHRTKNPADGAPAIVHPGRRPSRCLLVPQLRHEVDMWRRSGYVGASDTTRTLLAHWFETAHDAEFRYYYCQREAIETIIWLYEVAQYRNLSAMYSSLYGEEADETLLRAITPAEDAWARYGCKIATGGGKTKVMSLAIVWSYFHSLLEPHSEMPRHFVVIAPNLIVFERLREDFQNCAIFDSDPLVPPEWKDDFDLQVVLQDQPGGEASRGTLYLTNIHRLYERESAPRTRPSENESPPWSGPDVKRAQALKVGEALRRRIAAHPSLMVLNDEAHHLHDPECAWNEALDTLDKQSRERGNRGVAAQLDFTATPKHNDGSLFRHVICDFPLGEAVDAGIVKVPVLGKSDALTQQVGQTASQKWRIHLKLGYKQYEHAYEEWSKTRKPILFVMTEDTTAANEIAGYLDDKDAFPLLHGRVLNLHTRLKGKVKTISRGGRKVQVFEENEKQLSDEDLNVIRQFSRDLDAADSPYRCVVSVLMLREGWDVRNVTTIVPLRPYSAESNILAEQTLGRGLRRMTPAGEAGALERVTCVEHPAFVKLYEQELAEEGLPIGTETLNGPRPVSMSIFVDAANKPVGELEVVVPRVSDSIETIAVVEGLTFEDVRSYFMGRFNPLPIGRKSAAPIVFQERALFTEELVASWKIDRGLLAMGYTAISVFVQELEKACRLQSAHAVLGPLVQRFIEEVLFERPVSVYDGSIDHRMADPDVIEHIRATFTPLIRSRTVLEKKRERGRGEMRLSTWKPYQASHTVQHPCTPAARTMFNLVPCNRDLEVQFADFCDNADDITAFAKNAGPQRLLIDYMSSKGRPAHYTPDFLVRLESGHYFLVETKGQEDVDVPLKARAAVKWCASASVKECRWTYVFVPQVVFDSNNEFSMESLARACAPRLASLLDTLKSGQAELSFELTPEEVKQERTEQALADAGVEGLPPEIMQYVTQALNQLAYDRKKNNPSLGGSFFPLLMPFEELCGQIMRNRLAPHVPANRDDNRYYFGPFLGDLPGPKQNVLGKNQRNLEKFLVHGVNCNRIGTFLFCLEYAARWGAAAGGVWEDVEKEFSAPKLAALHAVVEPMNNFRNRHVAHVDEPLTDGDVADAAMKQWVAGLHALSEAAGSLSC